MVYSPIDDFVALELLTAEDLNHIIDNIEALKDPPSDNYDVNEGADYTTTSTVFVGVHSSLVLNLNTTGGDVIVHFHGSVKNVQAESVFFNITVDGVLLTSDDGIIATGSISDAGGTGVIACSFTRLLTGLSAGSHEIRLRWKVTGGTGILYAGAGTSNRIVHPQFWGREV